MFWDQRGHGRSQAGPAGSATIDQLGSDLARVIEAVAPQGPLILVGHSMGGMTVMSLAAHHPELFAERVLGVGFISTSAGGTSDVDLGMSRLGRLMIRMAPSTVKVLTHTPRLVEHGRRIGSDLEAVLVRRYSYASPVSSALVAFTADMIAATRLEVISDFMTTFTSHDKREALAAVNGRELLVIVGDSDLLTPADQSADIVARLPGAELVVLHRGGHLLMLEHPTLVNDHLVSLFERAIRAHAEAPSRRSLRKGDRRRGRGRVTHTVTPLRSPSATQGRPRVSGPRWVSVTSAHPVGHDLSCHRVLPQRHPRMPREVRVTGAHRAEATGRLQHAHSPSQPRRAHRRRHAHPRRPAGPAAACR